MKFNQNRIKSKTETEDGASHTYGYEYDGQGRLTAVTRDGASWRSYGYDANGNRTSDTSAGGSTVTADYDGQDRLISHGGTTYHYTAAGELSQRVTSTGTTHFDYDAFGQLRSVELPGGSTVDYVLDGDGNRVGKKVDGTLVQRFVYGDGAGPIAELAADGTVESRFVYGTSDQVPDYMVRDGHRYRFVTDDLGSVRMVVDADTGTVEQELDYDPFGTTVRDTNPGFQPFGWAGGVTDPDTHLIHFGARDYDPETAHWTSKDPIGFDGGDTNLYGYTLDDPINLVDLTGESWWEPISEGSAGAFDTVTGGLGSKIFGVHFCSTAYDIGSLLGNFIDPELAAEGLARTTVVAASEHAVEHEASRTSFIGFENGPPAVVPSGATGPNPTRAPGMQYSDGSGGNGLDSRTTGVRVMDETSHHQQRVVCSNKEGQTVDPYTGKTVPKSDPWAHIPW